MSATFEPSGSGKSLQRALHEAEHGDLQPQFNPLGPAAWAELPHDLKALEPVLLDRFFQLSRPIADARFANGADLRLADHLALQELLAEDRHVLYSDTLGLWNRRT